MEFCTVFTGVKYWNPIHTYYWWAFAYSILPYLHPIVTILRSPYLATRKSTGLTRFIQITERVRCCLYTGSPTSMCSYLTYLHPGFIPFWSMCISNFHIFAHDGTSTAVQLSSPYHPSQLLLECCYPPGSLFPAASHPEIALHACAGRLLMMEHEVNSIFKKNV